MLIFLGSPFGLRVSLMRIGILGGTGNMGRGLALRLSLKHDILVGSRDGEKARRVASSLTRLAMGFYQSGMKGSITGVLNEEAVEGSELVIESLPPEVAVGFLRGLRGRIRAEHIVVSCVVPMTRRKKLFYWTPIAVEGQAVSEKSAAEFIQEVAWPAKVVSAFQTVPAPYLSNLDSILNLDVLIAGDDELAVSKVSSIVRDIPNLRPLRVGPLENSKWIESLTPLLLNAAILNGLHEPSIRIVPWMPIDEEP